MGAGCPILNAFFERVGLPPAPHGYWFWAGGGVGGTTRIPVESKTKVFTSASAPAAGISWPFQRKVTPAALPILATISREARTDVWAGAISVSWLTVWPSARTEIHEVSVARITSVRGTFDFSDRFRFDFGKVRTVTSLLSGSAADPVAGAAALAWGDGDFGVDERSEVGAPLEAGVS